MKLQGRILSIRLTGADVKLLHTELTQLGLPIPDDERRRSLFGPMTEAVVKAFQKRQGLRLTGVVDEVTAMAINREVDRPLSRPAPRTLAVRGTVTADDGAPAVGLIVRAFDRELRSEALLGTTVTDRGGAYEIRYELKELQRRDKEAADLVVRVLDGKNEVIATSATLVNAGALTVVDLTVDLAAERPSEYEQYIAHLASFVGDRPLAQVAESDLAFLADKSGIAAAHIAFLATAQQLAAASKLPAEFFYAVFRQGLPTTIAALALQATPVLERALAASFDGNIVPGALKQETAKWIAAASGLFVEQASSPAGRALAPVRILAAAGLSADEQRAVLTASRAHADPEAFWASLSGSVAGKAGVLQEALKLSLLTGHNAPVAEVLETRGIRSVHDLAAAPPAEVVKMLVASAEALAALPPGEANEPNEQRATRYVEGLRGLAEATRPTAFIRARRLASTAGLDRDLARVLTNAPTFELRDDDVDRFLSANPGALQGVADRTATRRELLRVQRVLRIAPTAERAEALLSAGLDSAHAIARVPAAVFEAQFAGVLGGAQAAREQHAIAQRLSDTVLAAVGAVSTSLHGIGPLVVPGAPSMVAGFPNLAKLFGAQDLCACRECRSVLSPAAYLVDLLEFVNPKAGPRPLERLRQRRPDIEHIPLSCENTHTPLPYLDLVNEILEFQVANGALSPEAAHDTGGLTPEVLGTDPQFVIDAAYTRLAEAVYPPSLPFNRPLAHVRRYLRHVGTSRHELMEVFTADPGNANTSVALEYLHLSPAERDILIGAAPQPLGAFYGLTQDPSTRASVTVAELTSLLGVSHDELLALLRTHHLNPAGTIVVSDPDNPPRCDSAHIVVRPLTADFWRRAHRFVRLARRLNWSMSEVDGVLRVLGDGEITAERLGHISTAERLDSELGLSRTLLLTFWDANGTAEQATQRTNALARSLTVAPADLDTLTKLSGLEPFASADPGATERFVELALTVRRSRMSIDELAYVYERTDTQRVQLAPTAGARTTFARTLRAELLAADLDHSAGALVDVEALDRRRRDLAVRAAAEATELSVEDTWLLLEQQLSAADGTNRLIVDLLAVAGVSDGDIANPAHPATAAAERALLKLHKAAVLIRGLQLAHAEVDWIAAHGPEFGGFAFDALPLDAAESSTTAFSGWLRLADLVLLRDELPKRQRTLVDVFRASAGTDEPSAREAAARELAAATGWNTELLEFLLGAGGLNFNAAAFRDVGRLKRLARAATLSARVGVSAERIVAWARTALDDLSGASGGAQAAADDVIVAVRSRYDAVTWASIGRQLRDSLREAQRDGLVAWLLAHDAGIKSRGIRDEDGLFEHFLIDPGMTAAMSTSRVKQAISSVQLFIQRALMNREPGVSPADIDADQWTWMKNYRVWEANRKVFLFPENWIEPDLRDDKSPIFRALETELLQADVTMEAAEDAVEQYLERLHDIGKLTVCGFYVEDPEDNEDEEVLHLFGRTEASPPTYYYRRLIGGRTWTPWEQVDAGIEGDHLVPVVANRRLYVFWLHFEERQNRDQQLPHAFIQSNEHWQWQSERYPAWEAAHQTWLGVHAFYETWKFIEGAARAAGVAAADIEAVRGVFFQDKGLDPAAPEPREPQAPEEPAFSTPPRLTHWEISLAWSELRSGRWTPKQTSPSPIISRSVSPTLQQHFTGFGGALALGAMNEAFHFMPKRADGVAEATIFAVHLPTPDAHYLKTSVNATTGRLAIGVYRRYEHAVPLLNLATIQIEGHDKVGDFTVRCGEMASARTIGSPLAFEALPRPDGTTNDTMWFTHVEGPQALRFSADGDTHEILGSIPDNGAYHLLTEHQFAHLRLLPPYQDFVYQDRHAAYLATGGADGSTSTLRVPPRLPAIPASHRTAPLVAAAPVRLTGAPSRTLPRLDRPIGATRRTAKVAGLAAGAQLDADAREISTARLGSRALGRLVSVASTALGHLPAAMAGELLQRGLQFHPLFHPHVCAFRETLTRDGIPGLFDRATQLLDNDPGLRDNLFARRYDPSSEVRKPYPREHVDFSRRGAYAGYNWELFFHVPMLVAGALARNQRFEEAMSWYHFVFDPTSRRTDPGAQRYWNTLPFFTNSHPEHERIQEMLRVLAERAPGWKDVADDIEEWRKDPLNPHLIARLRVTAYQKNVVMKYIDNLVAWGDQLFRRDTIESINEASMLYVLAQDILGPRPQAIPSSTPPTAKTYAQLASDLDEFGNLLIETEQLVPYSGAAAPKRGRLQARPSRSLSRGVRGTLGVGRRPARPPQSSVVQALYFCVPQNQEMLARWDTVGDRLFKIRHSQNIDGATRTLPLFEPPIDPALLVRARAAGLDLSTVLDDTRSGLPHYRFAYLVQRAHELCAEVRSFALALLTALEKRDAEQLQRIRTEHERVLLERVSALRQQQVDEAVQNRRALEASQETARARYAHYQRMLGAEGSGELRDATDSALSRVQQDRGVQLIAHELSELDSLDEANDLQRSAAAFEMAANIAHIIGDIMAAPMGAGIKISVGDSLSAFASYFRMQASNVGFDASLASKMGQYVMRAADWTLQSNVAVREVRAIEQQIVTAEIREGMARRELENHETQLEHARSVEALLRDRYTNTELHQWMIGQISALHFQAYQLAFDMAKRAERAYRHELGLTTSAFVDFGYWDSLRKGLLAGDRLHQDVRRMETAYVEQNRREYEITKHVSLAQLDPLALLRLKQTGTCAIGIPEAFFDIDCPGHYMRRLKSVGVSVPCVAGPYTSVNCTLTLLKSSVRTNATLKAGEWTREATESDDRFSDGFGAIQSIVTSSGQNDSGLFEVNLRDERFLPFEGAGAISEWRLELPARFRQFDYDTIADVILHVRYTARDGGAAARDQATSEIHASINEWVRASGGSGLVRMLSLKHDAPNVLHQLVSTVAERQAADFDVTQRHLPYVLAGSDLQVPAITLAVKPRGGTTVDMSSLQLTVNDQAPVGGWSPVGDAGVSTAEFALPGNPLRTYRIAVTQGRLDAERIEDILLILPLTIGETG